MLQLVIKGQLSLKLLTSETNEICAGSLCSARQQETVARNNSE